MTTITKTSYAILGMLTIEPMSGYDIRQLMKKTTGNFWSESDGQLYPNLAKLAQDKFILCKSEKPKGSKEKKIYRITALGKIELKKWLEQESETSLVRNEFLLKIFFGANASSQVMLEHIHAYRYATKLSLSELFETKKELRNDENSPHFLYWKMSVMYGIRMAEAKLLWCDEVIKNLENKRKKS